MRTHTSIDTQPVYEADTHVPSAAKPSDFSDSVRFLKALPKTGPKRETSEKQPKCRRSLVTLLSYAEVLYFPFSAQLKAQLTVHLLLKRLALGCGSAK